MSAKISDTRITSDLTRHSARAVEGGWEASWLPGRVLDRNQALTAVTLAELVAGHDWRVGGTDLAVWVTVDALAAELGISGPHAVAEASRPLEDFDLSGWLAARMTPGGAQAVADVPDDQGGGTGT